MLENLCYKKGWNYDDYCAFISSGLYAILPTYWFIHLCKPIDMISVIVMSMVAWAVLAIIIAGVAACLYCEVGMNLRWFSFPLIAIDRILLKIVGILYTRIEVPYPFKLLLLSGVTIIIWKFVISLDFILELIK